MRFGNVAVAELDKLRTLPAAVLTAAGTVVAGALLAVALAAWAAEVGTARSATDVTLRTVPFAQAGLVLLGVLPAGHEYAGRQIRATLTAVPDRRLLVAAKSAAALVAVVLTAAATVAAGAIAAVVARHALDPAGEPAKGYGAAGWPLLGAAVYLALIGLLSYAVALLVRHVIPALVGVLGGVLIVSPLLAGVTDHARWLPARAGSQLYDRTDTVLGAGTGALVVLGWIIVLGAAAGIRFIRRDP